MKRVRALLLLAACVTVLGACGEENTDDTAAAPASEASADASADLSNDDFADTATVKDADGNDVTLIQTDSFYVYGSFTCLADGSVWTFDGDSLAVASSDGGTLASTLCQIGYYQTDDEEPAACLALSNKLEDTVTIWYLSYATDDEENQIGFVLRNMADTSYGIQLVAAEYYEEYAGAASGDATQNTDVAAPDVMAN